MSKQLQTTRIGPGCYQVVFKGITWSVRHDRQMQRWLVGPVAGGQIKGQCFQVSPTKKEALNWIKEWTSCRSALAMLLAGRDSKGSVDQ